MANTQQEWFRKLKGWVPEWVFENEESNVAVFNGVAKVLTEVQGVAESHVAGTFIKNATGELLALHGSERSIDRVPGESDESYRQRIRLIENTTSGKTIRELVSAVLNNGTPIALENWDYGFADDELFFDCEDSFYLSRTKNLNHFTVVIPPQDLADDSFFKSIAMKTIDDNKSLGVFGDVLYRVVVIFMMESGDQILLEDGSGLLVGEGSN